MVRLARIDEDDIRRVREATDLVALIAERVVLKQKGRLFWGCCPFHNERTPSFKIDPDTQLWHCFGCGKGGDVFGYMMEAEKLEFPEAVRALADRAHIEIKETGGRGVPRGLKDRLMQACDAAAEYYHMQLMRSKDAGAAKARAYLGERGFGSGPSATWGLGYSPGRGKLVAYLNSKGFTRDELVQANLAYVSNRNGRLVDRFYERAMFPIHDLQGRTIAFGGRVIGSGEPKYLNTSDTPIFNKSNNMFGIDKAKNAIVNDSLAIVVEGYTDVIALHEAGIRNAVATLGTALTAQHVKMLSRFATKIVYLFDGDAAGQRAADRASEFIDWSSAMESSRNPIDLRVVVLPGGKDPAEFVAAEGADALRAVIAKSEPLLSFSINRCLNSYDLHRPEQKARAMEAALKILYPIKDSVSATDYVNLIADRLNVEYTAVAKALKETRAPMAARHPQEEAVSEPQRAPMGTTASKVFEADQRFARMERELVALAVTDMRILDDLDKGFLRISWMDAAAEAMADALLATPHTAPPADALLAAQEACPQAATLLSEVMVDTSGHDDVLYRARLLLRSLRERDLERAIRESKAQLRNESDLNSEEMDQLFERTISLQKELVKLRNTDVAKVN